MKAFFISSTFKDMQAERDILHEKVFPKLRQIIRKYGDEVQEVDLRWGVDTVNMSEEESGHEVLKICIDAIDRCKPYLIVLLGERYGWIPGMSLVEGVGDTRISDRYEDEMSVTELEIQYGALLNNEAFEKCIFCFRDPSLIEKIDEEERAKYCAESQHHEMRLKALKKRIRACENAVILDYSAKWDEENKTVIGLEDFEINVFALLKKMIENDFSENEPKTHDEMLKEEVEQIKRGYLSSYVRRYPEEFGIIRNIGDFEWNTNVVSGTKEKDCVVLTGAAGSGKSAVMAFVSAESEKCNIPVITCFASASGCTTPILLKKYIVSRLEELLNEHSNEKSKSYDERLRELDKKAKGKAITCFVDAIDQIYSSERTPYIDLVHLCPNIFWVFSSLDSFDYKSALADCRYEVVFMGGMTYTQRAGMITETAAKRGKKPDAEIINSITENSAASNPLYISLVLQRLFMMNKQEFEEAEKIAPGMEGLHIYMGKIVASLPDDAQKLICCILDVTAKMFEQKEFFDILILIALSKNGLSESELSDLLSLCGKRFSPIGFQQIVSYLYDGFSQNSNGKWIFAHRLFNEAVLTTADDKDKKRMYDLLVRYSEENSDFMEREGFYYLLGAKRDSVATVFENAPLWDKCGEVYNEVGCLSRDDEEYRSFFKNITNEHPSEKIAEFWLDFQDFVYGENVEKMTLEIIKGLSQAELSGNQKCELMLRSVTLSDKQEALTVVDRAKDFADKFSHREKILAFAGIHTYRMRILTVLGTMNSEIEQERNMAVMYIKQALEIIRADGELKDYRKLFDYMKSVFSNASSFNSPQIVELLTEALEYVDSIPKFSDSDDFMVIRVTILNHLCRAYTKKQFRDYEKSKEYGNMALEIIEKAVSESPTVENLDIKMNVIYTYVECFREEYQYPFLEQLVDCALRLYSTTGDEYYKKELAYAEARYATSLGKAVNTLYSATKEDMHKCDEIWDHSFSLFEEVIASGNRHAAEDSYASYLVARAEVYCDRGYYNKAYSYFLRAEELFSGALERAQEKVNNAPTADSREYEMQIVNWCNGWLARLNGGMANIHLQKLELEKCVMRAKKGAQLSLARSSVISAHYGRALQYTHYQATAYYYLRNDDEALNVCTRLQELILSPDAQKYNVDLYMGEINYIRARIALERKDTKTALEFYSECKKCPASNVMYHDKLLILYADILSAAENENAHKAWRTAFDRWKYLADAEKKRMEQDNDYKIYTKKDKAYRRKYRRECRSYAITAYYMAYCLYHCITDSKSIGELCDYDDRTICTILEMTGKGVLGKIRPACFKLDDIKEECYDDLTADIYDSIDVFTKKLVELTESTDTRNLFVCDVIGKNSNLIETAIPQKEQFEALKNVAKDLYDRIFKDNVEYNRATAQTEIICRAFPLDCKLPIFYRDYFGYRVWSEKQIASRTDNRCSVLKLLLFLLRYENSQWDIKRKLLDNAMIMFRCIADLNGGEKYINEADLSIMTERELHNLCSTFCMENELRIKSGFRYWYELKNMWLAELYNRTGNEEYVDSRLLEFDTFLTPKYEELYQSYLISNKKDMTFEVFNAAMNFIMNLAQKDLSYMALKVAKWVESVPALRGKMGYSTLKLLKATTPEDKKWLEQLVMKQSEMWLGQASKGFWSLRML